MLAKRRALRVDGREIERTPLLVPSFSSKGFPDVHKIIDYSAELIDGPTLVSAYDIHYQRRLPGLDFPSLIFLDSGGYEASAERDASDLADRDYVPKTWTPQMHDKVLEAWRPAVPSVIISYDHPDQRVPIRQQIDRALDLPLRNSSMLREILLKPESSGQTLLRLPTVLENVRHLAQFDIIGVTEKEVGNSIFDRMKNIAQIRLALDSVGLCTPLHVFGSLDTVTTPMYFMAGADIFDGLTWLRFAYYKGQTVYKHNYGALKYGVRTKAHMIDARCWNDNYYYLKDLELEMRRYLNDHDTGVFRYHSDLFRTALEGVREAMGDSNGR